MKMALRKCGIHSLEAFLSRALVCFARFTIPEKIKDNYNSTSSRVEFRQVTFYTLVINLLILQLLVSQKKLAVNKLMFT